MKTVTRRSVATGLAAAVAGPALMATASGKSGGALPRPGELASLISRYWAEVDAFNTAPDETPDAELNARAKAPSM